MAEVLRGRWTHDTAPQDMVVFLIGIRVNTWWRVDAWLPATLAMRPMLVELLRDADSGLLGYETALAPRRITMIQYWCSVEQLYAYAGDTSAKHRPAWAAFNRRARRVPGAVGVWHETYVTRGAESVYVDMPASGLPGVLTPVPVAGSVFARHRLDSVLRPPAGDVHHPVDGAAPAGS